MFWSFFQWIGSFFVIIFKHQANASRCSSCRSQEKKQRNIPNAIPNNVSIDTKKKWCFVSCSQCYLQCCLATFSDSSFKYCSSCRHPMDHKQAATNLLHTFLKISTIPSPLCLFKTKNGCGTRAEVECTK